MGYVIEGGEETRKALQTAARHEMITRLEQDILMDMQVCELEGWDKMEYLHMLQDLINHFCNKN